MPLAEIPSGTLHYTMSGSSDDEPLVLLLPQSTGPVGIDRFIADLAQHHNVITYDQRGTGRSSEAPEQISMATQSDDLIGLLDALDVTSAALLCHSTGCGIGLTTVARISHRISSLILAAPWTHADTHLNTMQNLRIAAARALDPEQYARFNAALLYTPDYRRIHQDGFARLAIEATKNPQNADQIQRRLHAILAFDARPLLPEIETRTLVLTAKDDQLMPSWFAAEVENLMPNAQLVEFNGGGHMLLETRTNDIAERVSTFLETG